MRQRSNLFLVNIFGFSGPKNSRKLIDINFDKVTLYKTWNFCPQRGDMVAIAEKLSVEILMAIFGFSGPESIEIGGSTLWFKVFLFIFCAFDISHSATNFQKWPNFKWP